eukprot:SAG31_NODE_14431_length_807_cov_0.799435_1_plen_114_part_00
MALRQRDKEVELWRKSNQRWAHIHVVFQPLCDGSLDSGDVDGGLGCLQRVAQAESDGCDRGSRSEQRRAGSATESARSGGRNRPGTGTGDEADRVPRGQHGAVRGGSAGTNLN